jgi:hypothetical protein
MMRSSIGRPLLAAVVAALFALPRAVLAATPPGTYGGSDDVLEVSLLSRLMGLVAPLVGIAIVLGILIGLGAVVARIGGPVPATDEPAGGRGALPRSVAGRAALVVVAICALSSGMVFGWYFITERSAGGLGGAIGAAFAALALITELVLLIGVGLIATAIRRGHLTPAIRTLLVAGALVGVGAAGGGAYAAAFGEGSQVAAVALETPGTMTAELAPTSISFVARNRGEASCTSDADGAQVWRVTALDLGELGTGTLRANVNLPAAASGLSAEFWVDGGDLADGSAQPFWTAKARIVDLAADGMTGRVDVTLAAEFAASSAWPSTLSGSLSWTCSP